MCGDLAALDLQDRLQQIIAGMDVGVSQLIALVLGLRGDRVGHPATSLPSSSPLDSSPYAARSKRRPGSSVLTPCGSVPPHLYHQD